MTASSEVRSNCQVLQVSLVFLVLLNISHVSHTLGNWKMLGRLIFCPAERPGLDCGDWALTLSHVSKTQKPEVFPCSCRGWIEVPKSQAVGEGPVLRAEACISQYSQFTLASSSGGFVAIGFCSGCSWRIFSHIWRWCKSDSSEFCSGWSSLATTLHMLRSAPSAESSGAMAQFWTLNNPIWNQMVL